MTDEKGRKWKIGFTQSVSSGIIAFHGEYNFDTLEEFNGSYLMNLLKIQELAFTDAGYRVASDIKPKDKDKEVKSSD